MWRPSQGAKLNYEKLYFLIVWKLQLNKMAGSGESRSYNMSATTHPLPQRDVSRFFLFFCDSLNAMAGQSFKIVEYVANFSMFSVGFLSSCKTISDVPNNCSITRAFPVMYQVSTGSLTITGEIIELGTLNLFWNFSTKFDRF